MYPESNFLGSTSGVFILKYLSSSLFESKKRSVSSKLYVKISKLKIGWTQWYLRSSHWNIIRGTTGYHVLRWPNTVFARAFADAIQRAHRDCKKQTCLQYSDHFIYSTPALSVLFFSIIERSVLMALVFYYKDMLEKVTMQRTQQFSAFSLLPKEPS